MRHVGFALLLLAICTSHYEAQRVPKKFRRNRRPAADNEHRRLLAGLFTAISKPSRPKQPPVQIEYTNPVVTEDVTTPLPKISPFYMIVAPDLSKQKPTEYGSPSENTYVPPPPLSYSPFQSSSSSIDYSPPSSTLPPVYSPKTETAFSDYTSSQQHIINDSHNTIAGEWPPLFYNTIHGSNSEGFLL